MKSRTLILSLAGVALIIFSCGQEDHLMSPQLTQDSDITVLAKKTTQTPFSATVPLTVVDPGDIRVLPNGSLHIRGQIQQGPITGDLENSNADAVTVVIAKPKSTLLATALQTVPSQSPRAMLTSVAGLLQAGSRDET
ncbi:MAG: hypothetical protein ACE5IR_27045 [bacterium]